MSTRCQVKVIQEGNSWNQEVTLYHHCDGYPTGIIPLLQQCYDQFIDEHGWEMGRAGKVASFLCAADPGQFEPEAGHELHGDIEYYYKLYTVNIAGGSMAERARWEVEVYTVEYDYTETHKNSKEYVEPKQSLRLISSRAEVHELNPEVLELIR